MKKLFILTGTALMCAAASALARPEKLLAGYTGYSAGTQSEEQYDKALFKPMQDAGFNSVELKIHLKGVDPTKNEKVKKELAKLAKLAVARGLFFQVYLYPQPDSGKRNPVKHAHLPAFVNEKGETIADKFSLTNYEVWREMFANMFQMVELSKEMPIGAVKIDVETIFNNGVSYDDTVWNDFPKHKKLHPASRHKYLVENNLLGEYRKYYIERFDKNVSRRLERELHAINPDVSLGAMPNHNNFHTRSFAKYLGTKRAPAIFDDWSMYNGEGFTEDVLEKMKLIKKLNPNNLYIPWLRINSYMSKDIAPQIYHAASKTDGYSNWSMGMLTHKHTMPLYKLPGKEIATDYWAAYKKGNTAIINDLKKGVFTNSIALKKVTSLVPPVKLEGFTIPELKPYGNGNGPDVHFSLRAQQTVFIYAGSGDEIKVTISHLAGKKRPVSVQYVLLDKNKNILRNESVSPGGRETFSVTSPATGTYALVMTGGIGGQAWYDVVVHGAHAALDCRRSAYLFFVRPFPFQTLGTGTLIIKTGHNQQYAIKINDGRFRDCKKIVQNVKVEGLSKIKITAPHHKETGLYTQDFHVMLTGSLQKLIYNNINRALVEANAKMRRDGINVPNQKYIRLDKKLFGPAKTRDGGFWVNNITGSVNTGSNRETFVWVKYYDNGRRTMEVEINGVKENLPYTRNGPQWRKLKLSCKGPVIKYSFKKVNKYNPAIYDVILTGNSTLKPEDFD